MKTEFAQDTPFESRHNSPTKDDIDRMLELIKCSSLENLIDQTIPAKIRIERTLRLPSPLNEIQFINEFKELASKNKILKSYIGLGYHNCIVPAVIQRNILENPGWYTAYTPYQAEIAQGRLEALINFQTMVTDLTGMEIANASLLDEGTAAGEAMAMLFNSKPRSKKEVKQFIVDCNIFPQTLSVLKSRSEPIGIEIQTADLAKPLGRLDNAFGILVQYPNNNGEIIDYSKLFGQVQENGLTIAVATDLLSLTLIKPPGEFGVDVVIGNTQRFGVPMGYGGPHAAFFATREQYKRQIPGRIIGVSIDQQGNNAYRMALQTREQHIKRERATSNICTAQVLLAVMAGMYAVYHGPTGLQNMALRINGLASLLNNELKKMGFSQLNEQFFDTLKIVVPQKTNSLSIKKIAEANGLNFRYFKRDHIGITIDETTSLEDVKSILRVLKEAISSKELVKINDEEIEIQVPENLERTTPFLTHPVFNSYHSEHEMLRYIKRLENKDLSLVHSMISLGSCTMKLNATSEMIPLSWPEFAHMHPFAPLDQTTGYSEIFNNLQKWLAEITGLDGISLQPNSGAQGEFAGLMVIRAYQKSIEQGHRNVALIPSSAHGTNPASTVMAGMKAVIVACEDKGNISIEDLRNKAQENKDHLSALMVTYPSTHGVFEEGIVDICQIIHDNGGQVYMDGANMNAQVGLTSPAKIGADVCHLNLHKTFCIPHGGGGPGMGPIAVKKHLIPFLPGNPLIKSDSKYAIESISSAPWGSASILTISYAYIAMMGAGGLTNATKLAILNANYIMERLKPHYPILYSGQHGRCAHEMIIDCRMFKDIGVEVEDIATRLMDYGYHAPTISFPVAGTLMIEPTESESLSELNKFCEALISIRNEIREVNDGIYNRKNNVFKNAPHTQSVVCNDIWDKPYSREKAAFPSSEVKRNKFWPSVGRIDSAFGDRNLFCSCIPIEELEEKEMTADV